MSRRGERGPRDGDASGGDGQGRAMPPRNRRGGIDALAEDGNQHLWSVSYADLLMVILAFFVVFDIKPTPGGDGEGGGAAATRSVLSMILDKLPAISRSGRAGQSHMSDLWSPPGVLISPGALATGGHASGQSFGDGSPIAAILADLRQGIPGELGVDISFGGDQVSVHFPDDVFGAGRWAIENDALASSIDVVVAAVLPFAGAVSTTFVGHADARPLSESLKRRVGSNMVLSSLRAAKAAERAVARGLDPRLVKTEGRDAYGRGSRSLSIVIREIGDVGGLP